MPYQEFLNVPAWHTSFTTRAWEAPVLVHSCRVGHGIAVLFESQRWLINFLVLFNISLGCIVHVWEPSAAYILDVNFQRLRRQPREQHLRILLALWWPATAKC